MDSQSKYDWKAIFPAVIISSFKPFSLIMEHTGSIIGQKTIKAMVAVSTEIE